jgi:signal transduction histidine kinase
MHRPVDVLLVDDQASNLAALEAILEGPDYRLIRATTADEALRALLKNDVAAIVLDIHMPDVPGVELAKLIKGNRKYREIPILFLTAYTPEDRDVVAGYGVGAADYLTKPIRPEILRSKISVFADLFRKSRELAQLNDTLEARVLVRTSELEKSEAALRLAAQQKDEFLAVLAHELRNPLAPIRTGIEVLSRSIGADPARTLGVMRRQVDHMVRLIDDLLDVARITGGRLELKKERVDLAQTVMTAIEMCRPFLEKRQQLVHTELQSPVFALADGARVGQIVANLLHNASKFSANGAELGVQLSFADGHAEIRVSDPGAGISADDLERVFEMFASGGKGGGLGIGLALSRKLADLHEGKLVAQSAGLAHGSTFTLVLPAEVTGATPPKTQPPQAVRGNGKRVLIIEDNHDAAEMLLLLLEQGDYSVTLAHSGSDGLRQAREQRPSILLCDIGLPDMTGLEVCRQIRSQDLGYRPTLIALTGWGMEHDIARSREAGFDHHLVKPVAPETLFDLLREL